MLMFDYLYDKVIQEVASLKKIEIVRGCPKKWQVLDEKLVGKGMC